MRSDPLFNKREIHPKWILLRKLDLSCDSENRGGNGSIGEAVPRGPFGEEREIVGTK